MENKDYKENFIKRAKSKHGDKYDYSKVNYINVRTPVEIVCPIHGSFFQLPNNHIINDGCPKCNKERRVSESKEHFLKRAHEKYGDKYDYSKVDFINTETKVKIICPKHGEFEQTPYCHLKHGCKTCVTDGHGRRKSQEQFISEVTELFKDKGYDFSKAKYEGANSIITVICPIHGEFTTTPHSMLSSSRGCPKCNGGYQYTLNDFLEKARHVHGDKYDYSKVNYTNCHERVEIICPEHGSFYQQAYVHLGGSGCPKCVQDYKLEREVRLFLKEKEIEFYEQYSWDWLKYKYPQRVDFYLPKYSAVIECQGKQHFCEKNYFNEYSLEKLEILKEKDKNKLDLCTSHGIRVFYYSNLSTKSNPFDYPYEVFEDLELLLNNIKTSV